MKSLSNTPLSFFADENIAPRLVELLRIFDEHGSTLHAHQDYFKPGTPDEVIFRKLAEWNPKPVFFGGGGRILRNPGQLAALQCAQLHIVVLVQGFVNLSWEQQGQKATQFWPKVVKAVRSARAPSIFQVKIRNVEVVKLARLADFSGPTRTKKESPRVQNRSA